jgi:amphi-Trp domain-containing protein
VVSIPSRFRGRARRDAAAFYLSQLARGILAGELGILAGHDTVSVRPADFLMLKIAVGHTGRATHVSVRIRWSAPREPNRPSRAGDRGPKPVRHFQAVI